MLTIRLDPMTATLDEGDTLYTQDEITFTLVTAGRIMGLLGGRDLRDALLAVATRGAVPEGAGPMPLGGGGVDIRALD
jgi:hypothetical protein